MFNFNGAGRNLNKVFNMDESAIYLDCPRKYTFEEKGRRRVKINTHGGELARMSAAFTAAADGTKLPILVNKFYFNLNLD